MAKDHQISVHLLPSLFEPADVQGGIAVILDILRASSTMTTALWNGADAVVPFQSVEQALQFRDGFQSSPASPLPSAENSQGIPPAGDSGSTGKVLRPQSVLLGGERGGVRIEGFDLSNSPADYRSDVVRGRIIGFTTTNGTRALLRATQADCVVVGCFLNLSAVLQLIHQDPDRPVHLVCAGTDGRITGEDVLCAGALVHGLITARGDQPVNDSAALALSHWMNWVVWGSADDQGRENPQAWNSRIAEAMRAAHGGQNLLSLGYGADIELCSRLSTMDGVPCFDSRSSRITLLRPS